MEEQTEYFMSTNKFVIIGVDEPLKKMMQACQGLFSSLLNG